MLDRQIAPMEHEAAAAPTSGDNRNGAVATAGPVRDAGRELLDAQVAHERQQYQPTAAEKFFAVVKSMLMRGMIFYFFISMFKRPQAPAATGPQQGNPAAMVARGAATNLFQNGTEFDLYVYLSESEEFSEFGTPGALVWKRERLIYEDWYSGPSGDGSYSFSTQFPTSEKLRNNGSIYMHTYIVKSGKSPDPSAGKEAYSKKWTLYKRKQLNKHKKKSYRKTANLLTGETEASEEELAKLRDGIKQEIVSHWHPNITVNLVFDYTNWVPGQVPPPIDECVEFTPSLQNYKPIMYINSYWNMNKDYTAINGTVETLNFTVTYQPLSMFKWQMYRAQDVQNQFNVLAKMLGDEEVDQDDDEKDSLKEALLETNFYLLVLTFVVSVVHSVFEFLAFKNDIQFWNNRQSLEGLSVKSVFFNVFQSLIVLLYVLDNETNTIIKISCFARIVIELWKINKVMDVSLNAENPTIFGIIPRLKFTDKGSYEESGTKEYDNMAFKYLGALLFPLAIGYCVYSVVYNEHKGWYSFILSSCYGFLLTFGFIMMTPQLFINYKLKSVAHLPWRMMTYKALNTFIDDIFAFVIKMPTMYRIGCFRDDIIFFIFLYQRYIYRVDHSRVNEFGFSGDMLQESERKKLEGSAGSSGIQPALELKNGAAAASGENNAAPKKTLTEKKTD